MKRSLMIAGLVALVCNPLFAEQSAEDTALLALLVPAAQTEVAPEPEQFATDEPAQAVACIQACQWRQRCKTEPGGWTTTWKEEWCQDEYCRWYKTGQTCCWTSQPGTC